MHGKSPEDRSDFMAIALQEARAAALRGEVPVGAVVVCDGEIVGRGGNRTLADRDPTAHAEIVALRAACREIGSERLPGADLYVTLEPCPMCAGAISFARIRRLYFGAGDRKGGAVEHGVRLYASPTCHHAPDVYSGIGETEAAALLMEFFQARR
jgi:tRNA(adenine34) deaminase